MCVWAHLLSSMQASLEPYLLSQGWRAKKDQFAYWAVVVLGNLFVIGLEGFIVTIQTMRLHYYEFFSKFFQGGGSAYEPLALASAKEK